MKEHPLANTYLQIQICEYLNFEEIVRLLSLFRIRKWAYPIPIFDPIDHYQIVLPGFNKKIIKIYCRIRANGLIFTSQYFIKNGKHKLVATLLRFKFSPNLYNDLLFEAVQTVHSTIVEMLILAGADVNSVDCSKQPLLIVACKYGSNSVVQKLLEYGAKIDPTDPCGRTALMAAVMYQRISVVDTLLKTGANIHLIDQYGRTALDYALQSGKSRIIDLMKRVIS